MCLKHNLLFKTKLTTMYYKVYSIHKSKIYDSNSTKDGGIWKHTVIMFSCYLSYVIQCNFFKSKVR